VRVRLDPPSGPKSDDKGGRMPFTFKLELADGTPATPPTFGAGLPDWQKGDVIFLGRDRMLRVLERRDAESEGGDDVLVVEPVRKSD
jgi:hypothetical protein